jgi:hypothetical protein
MDKILLTEDDDIAFLIKVNILKDYPPDSPASMPRKVKSKKEEQEQL